MTHRWLWIALLAALTACEGMAPIGGEGGDAGDASDASDASDGANRSDGGSPPDAATRTDAAGAPDLAMASPQRARYPAGMLHSPVSPWVASHLGAVLAKSPGRKDVFAKVGASITVSTNFLHCFAGGDVKLDQYAALEPSRAWWKKTSADGVHTSFDRASLAAVVGWSAGKPLQGNPSPLEQEVAAIKPAFAVVMLGTNDTYVQGIYPFEKNLLAVVDGLLARGVVPLVSTIPPRGDTLEANALVPEMNAIIRAVAQARQVPFLDLWQTLVKLPAYGLAGDGVHLQAYVSGGVHACWLTPPALQAGMNRRNLITLEALDRARRLLVDGGPADAEGPPLVGDGTWKSPLTVDALPFVDDRDTAKSTTSVAAVYSCGAQNEGGPEVVYRVQLAQAAKLRARVFVDDGVDVDLHWLDGPAPDRCLARADKQLDVQAGPGTYWLVADTFVSGGVARSGAYRLTLVRLD
ncbi:MAG: SGNH/GDSL hydrolase family protein [Myxococcales bacterium]|nr:SGNH/GDSL hydrolase family protein [Myxococcales bacterium]